MTPAELRALHDADVRTVMGTQAGRRFVRRLVEQSGLLSPVFADSPTATAYNDGRRAVAIALLQECQRVCPELWVKGVIEDAHAFLERLADVDPPAAP